MAKIKITESQLKMIAKHKALNESFDEPESNLKSADFWNWRESNQDDELRTSIFEKIERMYDAGKIGEQDAYELMATYDNKEFGAEEDLTDLDTPRRVFNKLKKHNSLNESFDEPEVGEMNEYYNGDDTLDGWEDETRSAVRKLSKVTIEHLNNMSDKQKSKMELEMSQYDENVYDFIMDQVDNVDASAIVEFAKNNEEEFGTESQFVIFAIDDFCSVLGIEDDGEDMEDEEPIDYTMGRHDDPNMMPNPPREINLDLNEGQLLLKKVFNQFK